MEKIMNTKLTLRMDERLIESAKEYAAKTGKSVSKIVADYFASLQTANMENENQLGPTVRSLKGVLKGSGLDVTDYRKHLEKKYR